MSKLLLIDGNAIIHRAYHAVPAKLTTKDGRPINAVYGFLGMMFRFVEDLNPTHIAVCFDRKEPTFRKKIFELYQSHRPETDKDLSGQFPVLKKVLEVMNIVCLDKAGYEADDIIGTVAKYVLPSQDLKLKDQNEKSNTNINEIIIVTGDKDQMQLVDEKVNLYIPSNGLGNAKKYGSIEVKEKLGVNPDQVVDLKAFMGDQSDNYPGVRGIGPKTAIALLEKYDTYQNVYKHIDELPEKVAIKLKDGKKGGDMSYKLAQIVKDVDINIETCQMNQWLLYSIEVEKVFTEIGFKTLKQRAKSIQLKLMKDNQKLAFKNLTKVVQTIARKVEGKQYAVRGTTSLVLQGIDMEIDDIDVIGDKETVLSFNKLFKKECFEKVKYSESEKYRSYFGKFNIENVLVEVYGEWEIKVKSRKIIRDKWSKKYTASEDEVTEIDVEGTKVKVTKVETELAMYSQMGRWNAYHKIKKQVNENNQQSLF